MPVASFLGFSEPVSCWTHYLAALAVIVGSYFLLARGRGNVPRVTALAVFSFFFLFLFAMSGTFHLLPQGWTGKIVLQHLDHAAIWTMIAGSFTPIHVILFRGFWRWGFLAIIWILAITGLVLKTVYFHSFPEWLGLTLYLGLGWMGALSFIKIAKEFGYAKVRPLFYGGLFYTVGALFDITKWPIIIPQVFGPHEIFHIFVILGAASHWLFVYRWSNQPIIDEITFIVRERSTGQYLAHALGERIHLQAESLKELKDKIHNFFSENYYEKIRPSSIILRIFREEWMQLPGESRQSNPRV